MYIYKISNIKSLIREGRRNLGALCALCVFLATAVLALMRHESIERERDTIQVAVI